MVHKLPMTKFQALIVELSLKKVVYCLVWGTNVLNDLKDTIIIMPATTDYDDGRLSNWNMLIIANEQDRTFLHMYMDHNAQNGINESVHRYTAEINESTYYHYGNKNYNLEQNEIKFNTLFNKKYKKHVL